MKDDKDGIVKTWLQNIKPIQELLGSILSFTHPGLYQATLASLDQYQKLPATSKYTKDWPTVFHGFSVICNRVSKAHIDNNGSWSWYDQVLSIGSYQEATMSLPDLGGSFDYKPGTVIQFSGNLLLHQVGEWDTGDRICYAHFVKKSIFDRMKITYPDWPILSNLRNSVVPKSI